MAKYLGYIEHPVITDSVIKIVDDAYGFLKSDSCDEWFIKPGAPAHQYRHVKIYSHRRCGFSTTCLKLLNKYNSSIVVTHSQPAANRLRQFAIEENLVPDRHKKDFFNNLYINDHIISESRMNDNWFFSKRPEDRHQLIILDCASMMKGKMQSMDRFRDRLWTTCDLLVELG